MAALPDDLNPTFPEPLEFFTADYIHPDNQEVMKHEAERWRLLSVGERIRLQKRVNALARELKQARYNQIVLERHTLGKAFRQAKREYKATTFIDDKTRAAALAALRSMHRRGQVLKRQYDALKPTYEAYHHFAGWLEYERQHRKDLKEEKKRDAKILKDMQKESKWIEGLVRDVFRRTSGCHYIKHEDGKKPKTIAPKFERVIIKPDAHHLYLSISKKVLWWYKFMLPQGVPTSRLQEPDVVENLSAALKRQCRWSWSDTGQLILEVSRLDSADYLPRSVKWRDAMKFYPKEKHDRLPYCVGIGENRKFIWFDFESDANVLIAGKQGSGKSNLVNGIIAALVTTHTPEEVRLILIDQKGGMEFTHWEEVPHLLWDVVKTLDGVEPLLKRLVRVMQQRMALLQKAKAKKLSDYNARVDKEDKLERLLLLIDELNTFVGLGRHTEDIHNLLMLLTSQGRACGIHVIAATQYPEVKVLPGRIKANMSVRLSGYMPTIVASQVVLDSPEASRIPNMPGRFAGTSGLYDFICQVGHIQDDEISDSIAALKRLYTDVRNELRGMEGTAKLKTWNEQAYLKASIEWSGGKMQYQALHKMLGTESPGERALSQLHRSLIDTFKTDGILTLHEDGTRWMIKRDKKLYLLIPAESAKTDKTDKPDGIIVLPAADDSPVEASGLEMAAGD